MKQEDMVVGRDYLHSQGSSEVYVYEGSVGESHGHFGDKDGDRYEIMYSHMTEAPQAKPEFEFEFDDEVEISFNSSFDDSSNTVKGKFKHLDPSGSYWVVDEDGFMRCGDFARKVEPMVTIYGELGGSWEITQAHMDKIIAGDSNV